MTADLQTIVPFQPPVWMQFEGVSPSVKLSMQDMAGRRSIKVRLLSPIWAAVHQRLAFSIRSRSPWW